MLSGDICWLMFDGECFSGIAFEGSKCDSNDCIIKLVRQTGKVKNLENAVKSKTLNWLFI